MSRPFLRVLVSLAFIAAGADLYLYYDGYVFSYSVTGQGGTPAPYVGVGLMIIGALGLLGVNVFRGGPLDARNDRRFE
jgi:hypothetical protein